MFFNGNFTGATLENNDLGFNGHPCEVTDEGPSVYVTQTGGFDLNATIDGLSTTEIDNWWLAPSIGDASQYSGTTLLNAFQNEFASPGWASEASTSECSIVAYRQS